MAEVAQLLDDPQLDLARELEQAALADDYFGERQLYLSVDFCSGIVLKAIGILVAMLAMGRIASWKEVRDNPEQRIYRPRQVGTGPAQRPWQPRSERRDGIGQ